MAHIPGQFWLVPKAWEVQGVPFVILATKPETGLVYHLEVRDHCLRIYLDGLVQSCDWEGDGGRTGVD